ncbi:sensor histidine kinase [Cohnella soli]|uniref:histidine kinase n=1 Tax=Cohnella soli TaxID=425005 RepID=A0ABW0HSG3_9BACL
MAAAVRTAIRNAAEKTWMVFANLSMQQKLLIVFVFLVSLPVTLVSYVSSINYTRSIEVNTTAYAEELTAHSLAKLDDYVTDLFNMSAMPLYNEDFLSWLHEPELDLQRQNSMYFYVTNLNKIKPDTVSVYIFDNFGNAYYNIKTGGKRSNFSEAQMTWARIAKQGDGRPMLVSTQEVSNDRESPYYAFSVIRELKDVKNDFEPLGYIVFDTSINAIRRQLESVDQVTKGKTVLVDESNRVVFDSEGTLTTQNISSDESIRKATADRGSFSIQLDGKTFICTYAKSALTNWKMLVYVPVEEVTRQASVTRNLTLLTTAIFIAFALFIAIAISYALTRPISKIKQLMQEVRLGNLDVRFNQKYRDEVGLLGRNFNTMIVRLQELLERVRVTETQRKEAELDALQSQINPHFIYNTLETIRMRAEINDDEEVADLTYILGKLLRYSVNHRGSSVTVRMEIEHLKNYFALQNVRFSGKYELVLDIAERWYDHPCIKLIFQPIVENALHHAFKNKPGPGTIRISAWEEGIDLVFAVADDGDGMDDTALKTLKEQMAGLRSDATGRGIGLRNVHERLRLQYGEGYGLSVESWIDRGTEVKIRLPMSDSGGEGTTC